MILRMIQNDGASFIGTHAKAAKSAKVLAAIKARLSISRREEEALAEGGLAKDVFCKGKELILH